MNRLFEELQQRTLWQVLAVYVGASWVLLQVVDLFADNIGLPNWVFPTAGVLLLIGLPIVLTTRFIQRRLAASGEVADEAHEKLFTWRNATLGGAGAFLLLFGFAGLFVVIQDRGESLVFEEQASDLKRIAVLPFRNVNGDEDNRLMAVGVRADLNSQLQKISALRPTAGSSVREYENTDKSFKQIADELGVEFLLEGSVQSVVDRVRVIVSLVDAATAEQLWTNTFNEVLTTSNLLDIQSNIARQVVDALETRLTPQDVASLDEIAPGSDLAAQTWYYRAIELNEESILNYREVRDYLLRAVESDPGYVAAWSLLARMESRLVEKENTDDSAARAARDRTVELAPGSVEAHLATGFFAYYANKDFDTALAAFREAERMAPSNADAIWPVGLILRRQGKWYESTEMMKRVVQLDPRNPEYLDELRRNLTYVGAFVDADAVVDRTLSVAPSNPNARQYKVVSLLHLDGNTDRARSLANELGLDPRDLLEGWTLARLDWFDGDNQRLAELGETLVTGGYPLAERYRQMFRALAATPGDSVGVLVGDSLLALIPATSQSLSDAGDRLIAVIATGRKEDLRREIERVERLVRATDDHFLGPDAMAMLVGAYGSLGDLNAGFAWMEELVAVPAEASSSLLRLYPLVDPYRDDPRFDEIIAKREAFEAEGAAWAEARRPWLP